MDFNITYKKTLESKFGIISRDYQLEFPGEIFKENKQSEQIQMKVFVKEIMNHSSGKLSNKN